jgi:predicted metal-dependent phosphoesterase TrpH
VTGPSNPGDAIHGVEAAAGACVDLQVHTTASDGALSPTAVVEAARAAQLVAIAITDHDSVDGLDEALVAGDRLGVRVVPGVELSTHFEDEELHLLGLHLGDRATMAEALAELRVGRVERALRMVATLNAAGIPVTMDAVLRLSDGGAVGRPHLARAMMEGGWVRDFREAFDKWIGFGRPAFVEKDPFAASTAIALVHRAGGLAIWAHPGDAATAARVARLAAIGLDGVEALHPSHPPVLVQKILNVVDQQGLVPSGGSDWHGTLDGHRRLGGQHVPAEWLRRQDARVTERARGFPAGTT